MEALDVMSRSATRVGGVADQFGVLGPLEVSAGGRPMPLGPPAQRALLAALILRAGEVVPVDTLVDTLWGARPPGSAANLVQVYVTRLRTLLEPGRQRGDRPRLLVTRAPGYSLAVAPEQVDARRFERLVAEARGAQAQVAAAKLREALALWRGEVLADLPGYAFVAGEQARMAGLRQAAREARVDADLELGRHAELIPELEALVAGDPLHERTWGQLMVALYRSGQQARALAAYETVRRTLAEELGLDPSPDLQRLEQAILRQDSALQPTRSLAPDIRTLGNLPAPLTSFIGRGEEISELRRLVAASRLVTMVGAGGAGKTRLALQTAAALSGEFSDGVWLVDLAPVRDPARVPLALAASLNVRDEPGRSMVDTLCDYLRHAQVLIVLDNCEHLVEACAELAATLLRACAGARFLATSQEALAVPGEVAWLLPPLSESSAVALFADRAAASGFRLSRETEPLVAQICRHLDGIPLAIELAAARLKTLSVREIAERLDDRFQLLSQVTRGAPARHRTLSAMVDWSYGLLSERERTLFDRVSVFAGGFTLDAVEAVGALRGDTVDVLTRLVDKSFVLRADGGSGVARYRLLETLRLYGHQRLEERGERDGVRARHAAYYLALAEETAPHLVGRAVGPGSDVWLDRLDAERANLRAALAWAFGGGDVTVGLRTTLAVWWLWSVRDPLGEGRRLVQMALEQACAEAYGQGSARIRAEPWPQGIGVGA